MRRDQRTLSLGALLLAGLAACTSDEAVPGALLARGLGRNLLVAPDGGAAAFLLDAAHPDDRAVPEDLFAGDLWLASLGTPPSARKVGSGVPSSAGAVAFAPAGGAAAWLAAWRFRAGEGELWAALPGKEPRRLAETASSFGWAPAGGALAFVGRGRLVVLERPLEGAPEAVADAGSAATDAAGGAGAPGGPRALALEGMNTFAWSPDGKRLAARAPAAAGGRLVLLEVPGGAQRELAKASTDFAFAADGALAWLGAPGPRGGDRPLFLLEPGAKAPRLLGAATAFAFSPDGARLGLLSTARSPGDAFGDLSLLARGGGAPAALGQKVSEWRFTPKGDLLFLAAYDLRSRAGSLWFAPAAGGPPQELSKRVQSFQYGPRGDRALFVAHKAEKSDFKLELWSAPLPGGGKAGDPRKVDEGVYGYLLSPDGAWLFWKSRCSGLRSCALFRAPSDGSAPPVLVAKDVAGFDLSDDGARLLVGHPHKRAARAVDLALVEALAPPRDPPARPFAMEVEPGARFVDAQGRRVLSARLSARAPAVSLIELK